MPELPEVETVRRGLDRFLPKLIVRQVKVFDSPKSFPNDRSLVKSFLVGASIKGVRRRAKVLMIDLSSDYSLVIHLKMTGQLVYRKLDSSSDKNFAGGHPNDSLVGGLPDRSTRVQIDFNDNSRLFFNDQRKFGWIRLIPTAEICNLPFFQKVGPEPLDEKTTDEDFIKRVRRRKNSMIKAAILDQSVIAGVGNIYADESLFMAKIHPETRVVNLTDKDLSRLFHEIVKVFKLSIREGGSTDRNYVDAEGRKGNYLSFAQVFRREGQPCFKHPGVRLQKIKVTGRGTHICPKCQRKII